MFLIPAAFDYADKILLAIGIAQLSASLTPMLRALVPPACGLMSYFLFNRHFSCNQMFALSITLTGVLIGCFIQLFKE